MTVPAPLAALYPAIDADESRGDAAEATRLRAELLDLEHEAAEVEEARFHASLRMPLGHGAELLERARALLEANGRPLPGEDP